MESLGSARFLTDQGTLQESMGIFFPFNFYIHSWKKKDSSCTVKNVKRLGREEKQNMEMFYTLTEKFNNFRESPSRDLEFKPRSV